MSKGKVLVTCGGIIGSKLAEAFADEGYEVATNRELTNVHVKIKAPSKIRMPTVNSGSDGFIQQKIQGKRRVY